MHTHTHTQGEGGKRRKDVLGPSPLLFYCTSGASDSSHCRPVEQKLVTLLIIKSKWCHAEIQILHLFVCVTINSILNCDLK